MLAAELCITTSFSSFMVERTVLLAERMEAKSFDEAAGWWNVWLVWLYTKGDEELMRFIAMKGTRPRTLVNPRYPRLL